MFLIIMVSIVAMHNNNNYGNMQPQGLYKIIHVSCREQDVICTVETLTSMQVHDHQTVKLSIPKYTMSCTLCVGKSVNFLTIH